MEFKGTKGKWIKSKNVFNEDNVKSEFGYSVCKITGTDIQEMNYNHQLIIKAPEMLEALQYFVNRVENGTIRSTTTYNKYKQLIKEATEI